jgi:hypothetical protein
MKKYGKAIACESGLIAEQAQITQRDEGVAHVLDLDLFKRTDPPLFAIDTLTPVPERSVANRRSFSSSSSLDLMSGQAPFRRTTVASGLCRASTLG